MVINLRLHARLLFERMQFLTWELETSEINVKDSGKQLLIQQDQLCKSKRQLENCKRQFELERARLYQSIEEIKHVAEKEKNELKSAIEKATAVFASERAVLQNAAIASRQELAETQNRLEENVHETAGITKKFKTFYEDYSKLEDELKATEKELVPIRQEIHELAEAMKVEPEELLQRLETLKVALKNGDNFENRKELLFNILLTGERAHLSEEVRDVSGGFFSPKMASDIQQNRFSSTELEKSVFSPGSEKVLLEQTENSAQEVTNKVNNTNTRKDSWTKVGFKIPRWSRRRNGFKKRYVVFLRIDHFCSEWAD